MAFCEELIFYSTCIDKLLNEFVTIFLNFQVAQLRDEISDKQNIISELKDMNQKFTLTHHQMQADHDRLKQEEAEKSAKLQELVTMNERREQVSFFFIF